MKDNHSKDQAKAQFDSIAELVAAHKLDSCGVAHEAILEDPLSVEVRSGWYGVLGGSETGKAPAEFNILLCTGGPAVRIIGTLGDHFEPDTARLEHQDWGTPWTEYQLDSDQEEILLAYCRVFYFGE
jgi:hypothetical protein